MGSVTMRMHISYYNAVIKRCSKTEIEICLNYNYLYCGLMCIPMWPTRMTRSQWYAGASGFSGSIPAHSIMFETEKCVVDLWFYEMLLWIESRYEQT